MYGSEICVRPAIGKLLPNHPLHSSAPERTTCSEKSRTGRMSDIYLALSDIFSGERAHRLTWNVQRERDPRGGNDGRINNTSLLYIQLALFRKCLKTIRRINSQFVGGNFILVSFQVKMFRFTLSPLLLSSSSRGNERN